MWDSLGDQTPRLKVKLESFEMFQINSHTPSTWFRNFSGGHRPKNVEIRAMSIQHGGKTCILGWFVISGWEGHCNYQKHNDPLEKQDNNWDGIYLLGWMQWIEESCVLLLMCKVVMTTWNRYNLSLNLFQQLRIKTSNQFPRLKHILLSRCSRVINVFHILYLFYEVQLIKGKEQEQQTTLVLTSILSIKYFLHCVG